MFIALTRPATGAHRRDARLIECDLSAGRPFFERARLSVKNISPNMFTLIALGVGSAFVYSLAATMLPSIFPAGFRSAGGSVMPYFDTAVVVTVLILLGLVVRARHLSRATMRNIRQNLFLAFVYNVASVPVAAGLLYPFVGLLILPIWASAQ